MHGNVVCSRDGHVKGQCPLLGAPPPTHYINVFYRAHGNRDTGALGSHLLQNLSCVRERGSLTCARKRSLSPAKTEEGGGSESALDLLGILPPSPNNSFLYLYQLPSTTRQRLSLVIIFLMSFLGTSYANG